MRTLQIPTAEVFLPLLDPARYKGAYGGRGAAKSHFFAGKLIEDSIAEPGDTGEGLRSVCIREVQKDLAQSSKLLIESKIREFRITEADGFKIYRDVIQTPRDGLMIFKGMTDMNADSIKSLEGFKRAWWEEAQTASLRSLNLLRPTIRAAGAEKWFSWNPLRKTDPTNAMLRGPIPPTGAIVVCSNWRDNPWRSEEQEQERLDCLLAQPDQYDHIWEGGYVSVIDGAYHARSLTKAKTEQRIGRVGPDPLMMIRIFCDIGGTGARADSFTMWVAQFIGREIRVLDYYEAVGQPAATHLEWLRGRGYAPVRSQIWLPHDGESNDKVFNVSYESFFRDAGYDVTVVPNQGKGAAKARIEAGHRLFPIMWFNSPEGADPETTPTCQAGLEALGWYHEKKDDKRNIGLGPEHDWSSHGCFHGATKVLTRYGTYQIMDLPNSGEVLTPCGWKQYVNPRITKRNAQLVEVLFKSGYSVKCTPDHLFLTESGWKSAKSLARNTEILSTSMQSPSISTGNYIGYGRVKDTCLAAAAGYIVTLGSQPLARYLKGAISITKTRISLITGWITSNVSIPANIASCLEGSVNHYQTGASSLMEQEPKLQSGTGHQRVNFGTSVTQKSHKTGQNGSVKKKTALNVVSNLWRLFARAVTHSFTAPAHARLQHTGKEVSKTNMPLTIERVRPLNERADVWDITVPDGHWFALENGAVVHNSDSFGLMCVAYELPRADGGKPVDNWRDKQPQASWRSR